MVYVKTWVIGGTSGIGAAVAGMISGSVATGKEVSVCYLDKMEGFYAEHGGFDNVVYSAGVNYLMRLDDFRPNTAGYVYDVNTLGFMRLLSIVANASYSSPCRSIVAISSDAAVRPMRTSIAYCASKAALDMAVRVGARELAPAVRVNAVSPGMVEGTKMTEYIDQTVPKVRAWTPEEARAYEQSQIPMRRRATTNEVAHMVAAVLFGPEYLTGAIIPVNGGR
jgi:NAD(P)-dependent dehydrogenase (short-subunit alcohol dehydrogenase family)